MSTSSASSTGSTSAHSAWPSAVPNSPANSLPSLSTLLFKPPIAPSQQSTSASIFSTYSVVASGSASTSTSSTQGSNSSGNSGAAASGANGMVLMKSQKHLQAVPSGVVLSRVLFSLYFKVIQSTLDSNLSSPGELTLFPPKVKEALSWKLHKEKDSFLAEVKAAGLTVSWSKELIHVSSSQSASVTTASASSTAGSSGSVASGLPSEQVPILLDVCHVGLNEAETLYLISNQTVYHVARVKPQLFPKPVGSPTSAVMAAIDKGIYFDKEGNLRHY